MRYVYENELNEIREIVENNAKYQKVMLLFDDSVSNLEIMDIYNVLKGSCIYNQMDIATFDSLELNNGYRLVIYKCSGDSLLRLNMDFSEFVNIFVPTDKSILPWFLSSENMLNSQENTLIQKKNIIDTNTLTSIYFNSFFSYFTGLFTLEGGDIDFSSEPCDISRSSIIKELEKTSKDICFEDVRILKEMDIDYHYLGLIDLMLINGFSLLISAVRNKSLMLVDIYKASKENNALIDKFYAMTNNDTFVNIVSLNYNYLHNVCTKTKEKIMSVLDINNIDRENVDELLSKIKNYAKNTDNILSYLYLYNVFDV